MAKKKSKIKKKKRRMQEKAIANGTSNIKGNKRTVKAIKKVFARFAQERWESGANEWIKPINL